MNVGDGLDNVHRTGLDSFVQHVYLRFGQLSQEASLKPMLTIFGFRRLPGESPAARWARCELLRLKTELEVKPEMSYTGHAFLILVALGIPMRALPNLLIPLGGNLPHDAATYQTLLSLLRQNEHYRDPSHIKPAIYAEHAGEEFAEDMREDCPDKAAFL